MLFLFTVYIRLDTSAHWFLLKLDKEGELERDPSIIICLVLGKTFHLNTVTLIL